MSTIIFYMLNANPLTEHLPTSPIRFEEQILPVSMAIHFTHQPLFFDYSIAYDPFLEYFMQYSIDFYAIHLSPFRAMS